MIDVFVGEDRVRRDAAISTLEIGDTVVDRYDRITTETVTTCRTLPLLAEKRIVIFDNPGLSECKLLDPDGYSPNQVIVLLTDPNKRSAGWQYLKRNFRITEFPVPRDMKMFVLQICPVPISEEAADVIASAFPGDTTAVLSELKKRAITTNRIEYPDVADLNPLSPTETDLIDAVLTKDPGLVAIILHDKCDVPATAVLDELINNSYVYLSIVLGEPLVHGFLYRRAKPKALLHTPQSIVRVLELSLAARVQVRKGNFSLRSLLYTLSL